jgi:hypothetical protein
MSEIKVEIGQVWDSGGDRVTVYGVKEGSIDTCRAGDVDQSDGYVHTGDDCCWRSPVWFEAARLVSPAPPPQHPARSAGQRWRSADGRELTLEQDIGGTFHGHPGAWMDTAGRIWWSWETMTLLAPQEAVVEKPYRCHDCDARWALGDRHLCPVRPVEPVKPAAPAKAPTPVCEIDSKVHYGGVSTRITKANTASTLTRSLVACDGCYLAREESFFNGTVGDVLHDDKIPERIARPRLAHGEGVESDTLENA